MVVFSTASPARPATTATPTSIAGLGDLDQDGLGEFAVGSFYEGALGHSYGGRVRFYSGSSAPDLPYDSVVALGPADLSLAWLPNAGITNALTGDIHCSGATPGGLGRVLVSRRPTDYYFNAWPISFPVLIAAGPNDIILDASFGFDALGTFLVPGVTRNQPALAGTDIFLQLLRDRPQHPGLERPPPAAGP